MAPKMLRPPASSISMRTRSPNFRNGVLRRAVLDLLEHAPFGEAGGAVERSRFDTVPEPTMRAGAEPARARRVRDELGKSERHVHAGVGLAERLIVDAADERQMHLAVAPGAAELIRRDRDGREAGRGLRLVEAETLRQLARESRLRKVQSFTSIKSLMCGAHARRAPCPSARRP